jgi:hypothetical protein
MVSAMVSAWPPSDQDLPAAIIVGGYLDDIDYPVGRRPVTQFAGCMLRTSGLENQ